MNKKENSENLVKKMLLSISIMSCFAAVGVDNVSAMRSIFGDVKKGDSDINSKRDASSFSAPMPALAVNNSQQNITPVFAPPVLESDKNTNKELKDSKIIVDTKEKSEKDSFNLFDSEDYWDETNTSTHYDDFVRLKNTILQKYPEMSAKNFPDMIYKEVLSALKCEDFYMASCLFEFFDKADSVIDVSTSDFVDLQTSCNKCKEDIEVIFDRQYMEIYGK